MTGGEVSLDRIVVTALGEADSPHKRSGHQLLGRSDGVTKDEARALTPLGDGAGLEEVWHLFQRLEGGRYAVGCVRGLAKRDWAGRNGVSFGQFWLIDAESFRLLDNDPFRVLRNAPFYEGVEEALRERAALGGRLPGWRGHPDDLPRQNEPILRADELRACLSAALRKTNVLFLGPDEATLPHLASVFGAIPPDLRAELSFVHGVPKPDGKYWARCASRRPRNTPPLVVEVDSQIRVQEMPPHSAARFESWVNGATARRSPEEVVRDAPNALARLRGPHVGLDTLEGLEEPLRSEIERVLRPEFQRDFLDRLANSVGRELANFLRSRYLPKEDEPMERLFETPSLREVAELLTSCFESGEMNLDAWYEPLAQAAILGECSVLELLVMTEYVLRQPDAERPFNRLRRAASEATEGDLRHYVRWLTRRVPIGIRVFQGGELPQLGIYFSFEPEPHEGRVGAGQVLYAMLNANIEADSRVASGHRLLEDHRDRRRAWIIEELLIYAKRPGFNG